MKKILFLINTLSGGGAEKVLVDLVNNLNSDEFDVTLQTISNTGIYIEQLNDNIRYKTINKAKNKFLSKAINYLLVKILPTKLVYKHFIEDNYDIEVAFLEGVPTKILSASENAFKYAWVHTDLYNYYSQKSLFGSIEKNAECYRKFKKIVCVSETAKTGFEKRFGFSDNVIVRYNPVNELQIINKANEELSGFEQGADFKVITVGRLVSQKGYDRLLKVHKRLLDEGIKYKLWIVGDGPEKEKLVKYISENDLNDSACMLGFQSNPYKFMNAADMYVSSSHVEGYSTVVTEATILGVPVLSTDCSGMREILGDSEYGLIVENSEEGLYNGMKKMLNDKSLLDKYRLNLEEHKKNFKMKDNIKKIEELFH